MRLFRRITDDLPPKGISIFFIVVGFILGGIFTFGNMYWFKTVSRDEALTVTAEFESYKVHYSRGHSQYVLIRFKNHEQLDIDTYCATDDVIDMVDSILPGNEVNMLVHPNSDTILEMEANGGYILRFEESMKRLKSGRTGYYFVGGFMYLLFIYGLFSLIYERNQNRRHKKSTG